MGTTWFSWPRGGRKLGIIGMGRIGQAFAKRAIAGMDIQYCNRRPLPQHIENELDATFIPDINQIASSSDVLSLIVLLLQKRII